MIVGFTIAKNCNREAYPIDLCIKQHKDLFDRHIIGVSKQDEDNTIDTIMNAADESGQEVELIFLDWPGDDAWTDAHLDRTLQEQILEYIEEKFSKEEWIIKIDADEFYNENDFDLIRETIEIFDTVGTSTSIVTNYRQFCGSLRRIIWDPTDKVFHIFKNKTGAKFTGSDAMIIANEGKAVALQDSIYLNHIGYVKDTEKITRRIREHLVLNGPVYPDVVVPKDWKFEFPVNKKGTRLWPLGIATLRGQPNETEYVRFNTTKLPNELLKNIDKFDFHIPGDI